MYTLCVIDMQRYFGVEPNMRVTKNSAREIHKAMEDGATILFVEYESCGSTLPELKEIAKDYLFAYTIDKAGDDGSTEIIRALRNRALGIDRIKLCGVNTDCCVYRTANGLIGKAPYATIEIVGDACDSFWSPTSHLRGLKELSNLGCIVSNMQ